LAEADRADLPELISVNLLDLREKDFTEIVKMYEVEKKHSFCYSSCLGSFAMRAQSVDKVINKYVNFIGGKEQWKK